MQTQILASHVAPEPLNPSSTGVIDQIPEIKRGC